MFRPLTLMTFTLSLFATLAVLGTSCSRSGEVGVSSDSTSETVYGSHYDFTLNKEAFDKILSNQKVTCKEPSDCPENVAKLVMYNEQSGKGVFCTGFLISPNQMLTNHHCVSIALASPQEGQSCSGRMYAFFPNGANQQSERVGCKRLVKASKERDFAIIELDSDLQRKPVTIDVTVADKGIKNNESLVVWKMDPVSEELGQISKLECQTKFNNLAFPEMRNAFSPTISLGDCDIHPGNSGSPVLDANGNLRAIIYATLSKNFKQELMDNYDLKEISSFGFALNLSCMCMPGQDCSSIRRRCLYDANFSDADLVLDFITNNMNQNISLTSNDIFNWRAVYSASSLNKGRFLLDIYPSCLSIKKRGALLSASNSARDVGNNFDRMFSVQVQSCEGNIRFNKYLQIEDVNSIQCTNEDRHLYFQTKTLNDMRMSRYFIQRPGESDAWETYMEGQFKECQSR